ncbi:hypothetical protein KR018_003497 [Drosophila ironensis]|nr:hypothetical protein KR018_003497 [Drosophila ironensis]
MPVEPVRPMSTYDNLRHLDADADADPANEMREPQKPDQELGSGSSHNNIAAVKAALSDAKSKFFGINNYESSVSSAPQPEPKYENVPKPITQEAVSPKTSASTSPARSLGNTTYEQIPLSDLDAPQPSQAVYMCTTVPQNMKSMKITGRHTPTRNSLRHSRMIMVNHKNHDTYSTHIRNLNLSRQLLITQLAVGLLIVSLSILILFLAPFATVLINPYLSGLSLLLGSGAGLLLLGMDQRTDQRRPNSCRKILVAESYVFSVLALMFCGMALVCTAYEFAELKQACGSEMGGSFLESCTCAAGSNDAQSMIHELDSCKSSWITWKYILVYSMALNVLGILATFMFLMIFILSRRSGQQIYTSV